MLSAAVKIRSKTLEDKVIPSNLSFGTKSMSLKYEPASEPLHIYVK